MSARVMASLEELPYTYFNDTRLCAADITRYCIQPLIELRTPGVYVKHVIHAASLSALSTNRIIAINYDGKFIVTDHSPYQPTPAKCELFDIQTGVLTDFPSIVIPADIMLGLNHRGISWNANGSDLLVDYCLTHNVPMRSESPSILNNINMQIDDNGHAFVRFTTLTGVIVDIYGLYIISEQTRKFIYICTAAGCNYTVNIINRKTGEIVRKHVINTTGMTYDGLFTIKVNVFQCGKYIVLTYWKEPYNACWNVYVLNKHGQKLRRMEIEYEPGMIQQFIAYPNEPKFAVICSRAYYFKSEIKLYANHINVYEIEEIKRTMYV